MNRPDALENGAIQHRGERLELPSATKATSHSPHRPVNREPLSDDVEEAKRSWGLLPVETVSIQGREGLDILRGVHPGFQALGPDNEFQMRAHLRIFDCLQLARLEFSPIAFCGSSPHPQGVMRLLIILGGAAEITDAASSAAFPAQLRTQARANERSFLYLPEPVPTWVASHAKMKALEVSFHSSRLAPYVDLPAVPTVLEIDPEMGEVITAALLGVAASEPSTDDETLRVFAENRVAEAFVLHANSTANDQPAKVRVRALRFIATHYQDDRLHPAEIARAIGVPLGTLLRAFKGKGGVMTAVRWKRAEAAVNYLRAAPRARRGEVADACGFNSVRNLRRALNQRLNPRPAHYRLHGSHIITY